MGARANFVGILADVIESRDTRQFKRRRDRALAKASRSHRQKGYVLKPYAVTAWDEFQSFSDQPRHIPRILMGLRSIFFPLKLRIAIGIGRMTSLPLRQETVNVAGSGEAFELARSGMEELRDYQKYAYRTILKGGDQDTTQIINLVLRLQDTLMERVTPRQWETMRVQSMTRQQDKTARRLGINESTVSRNLQRGFYWQLEDIQEVLGNFLASVYR